MEKVLLRKGIGFRKKDNAFLTVADPQALQEAADGFTPELIRPRLEYWTFLLGPKFSSKERHAMNLSRFYSISQVEYCRNFIFKRNFPIHKIFERSCELGLWRMTASLKQYEKLSTFLRNELCSNNLTEFGLKKGLDHLAAVRAKCLEITDRFAGFQAQCLNGHVDFPLLQKLALPVARGKVRFPGIKIHDTRMIRLLKVLLHGSTHIAGWRAPQLLQAVLQTYRLSPKTYTLNQLRYDLRKLKGHGFNAMADAMPIASLPPGPRWP